VTTDYHW